MAALSAAPVSADEYLKSVSPKSSIDAFLAICRGEGAPDSWCRCTVRNMVQTREGDFLVDAAATGRRLNNLQQAIGTERVQALATRHGMGRDEGLAVLKASRSYLNAASDGCS
jgi:hypothetical protein